VFTTKIPVRPLASTPGYTIRSPTGDHDHVPDEELTPGARSRRLAPTFASTTYSERPLSYAILRPSGDHFAPPGNSSAGIRMPGDPFV
jgi:hypothetical protein